MAEGLRRVVIKLGYGLLRTVLQPPSVFFYETTQLQIQFGSCLFTVLFHRGYLSLWYFLCYACLRGDMDQNYMNVLLSDVFISFFLIMVLFVSLEFNNTRKYMHSFDLMQSRL